VSTRKSSAALHELLLLLAALLACQSSGSRPAEEPEPPPKPAPIVAQPQPTATAPVAPIRETDPQAGDAPEISRSLGTEGGAVILWPRVVMPRGAGKPDAEALAIAGKVQTRLASIAERVLGGRLVDVRPEPERVCPKQGCKAASLGVLFTKAGGGCAVVALVSAPGTSPQKLIQWSPGEVTLRQASVPFRSPPEAVIGVKDYAACDKLPDALSAHDAEIEAAIRSVTGK
jgi:hypothetical protein